jgi:CheY-like chemotaxis protein
VRQSQLFDAIMAAIHRTRTPGSEKLEKPAPRRSSVCTGARVLLVEDNEVNQMVAMELLSEMGCVCEVAADGAKAVSAVHRAAFDVVLMDCQMPEMDGFEATTKIRELEKNGFLPGRSRVPVIALTANALSEDRARCLAAGMDDYLTKPLQPEKLLATMESYLAKAGRGVEAENAAAAANATATQAAVDAILQEKALPPLEMEPLLARCGGRKDFAEKVLAKFRVQSVELLEALVKSAREKDGAVATRTAHTLKGMAATVAAEPLKNAAAVAETLSSAADWDGVESQIASLRKELEECLAYIPKVTAGGQK